MRLAYAKMDIMMTEVMQNALHVVTHVSNVQVLQLIVLNVLQEVTGRLLQVVLVNKVIKMSGLLV